MSDLYSQTARCSIMVTPNRFCLDPLKEQASMQGRQLLQRGAVEGGGGGGTSGACSKGSMYKKGATDIAAVHARPAPAISESAMAMIASTGELEGGAW